MKRFLCIVLVLIGLLSFWVGCAAQNAELMPSADSAGTDGKEGESSQTQPSATDRKIIRNAELDIEAVDVVAAYDSILAFAVEHGGYETSRSQRKDNDYMVIDAEIRISPDHLEALLDYAAGLGDVINTLISTEDITDSYYDAKTRLQSMELALERYYDYLEKAKTIEESLSVQSEINNLTLEIESLKGRLRLWDNLLSESVVTLRLRQTNDPRKLRKEIDWSTLSLNDMAYLMKRGFFQVTNTLVGILQWLLIAIVAASPLWIVILLVLWVTRHVRKKKRKKPEAPPTDPEKGEAHDPS